MAIFCGGIVAVLFLSSEVWWCIQGDELGAIDGSKLGRTVGFGTCLVWFCSVLIA